MTKEIKIFKPLNPLLHSELRLAIMSLLAKDKKIDFRPLRDKTGATTGNISIQMHKLRDVGYITIEKSFKNNYPCTTLKITEAGALAYQKYQESIKPYIEVNEHAY